MARDSRREFLKAAGAAAAAAAVRGAAPAWAARDRKPKKEPETIPEKDRIQLRSSYRGKRHEEAAPLAWGPAGELLTTAIVLDPRQPRQEVLGFGAALTDSACYVLSQLPGEERAPLMEEFFSREQMNLSVCRTAIGSSDYARLPYSYDDSEEPDPELREFSIDQDKSAVLPILREARKVNPALFLFSSPWSPPGWMKSSNSLLGGAMRKHWFEPYARYFVKFLEAYKDEGVQIDAVTVQNEVDTDQDGRMPACLWGQEYETEFVEKYLGPALKEAGLSTDIWLIDHNYNLWGRAIAELSLPGVYDAVDGIAWHGYLGSPEAMTRVHDAFPQKHAHWTEGGPDIDDPNYLTDFATWGETFNGILNNWARSITAWNLALDEKGNPTIGPFRCGGTVTIENGTRKVIRSGQYWALAHFSRHIRRGARVYATNALGAAMPGISHCALHNPDGSHVLTVANRGPEQRVQIVLGEKSLTLNLPAESLHTLTWG